MTAENSNALDNTRKRYCKSYIDCSKMAMIVIEVMRDIHANDDFLKRSLTSAFAPKREKFRSEFLRFLREIDVPQ